MYHRCDMHKPINVADVFIDDPLGIASIVEDNITTAMESISSIYHGLIVTPHRAYADKRVQESLRTRIDELSLVTSISSESVHLAIDQLTNRTYSSENAFFDTVKTIIEKVLEWLAKVRDLIVRVIRSIISVRNQNNATNAKTASDFKETKREYERTKQGFPEVIRISVPGACYLAFHTTKHKPKAGFVYNTAGLEKAIDNVDREMNIFINNLTAEADNTLDAVSALIGQLSVSKTYKAEDVLRKINNSKVLDGLYHNNFEMVGFGLVQKPVRNATRYIRNKYGLTNTVDAYSWNTVDTFELSIETAAFEKLQKSFADKSDETIGRIVALNQRLADSRAVKQLAVIRRDIRQQIDIMVGLDPNPSITLTQRKELQSKLELIYELIRQLTDTCLLAARFYTRYTLMQGKIFQLAGDSVTLSS
jgi:hypothetical protein